MTYGRFSMMHGLVYAFKAVFKSRAAFVAENLCLRQQLLVLKRHQARPQFRDADRPYWVLACQWFSGSRRTLNLLQPDTGGSASMQSLLALAFTPPYGNREQENQSGAP